ncbi:hypothetical protein [Nonomuraea rhizosphaerae]|uniref:hypothetical protein n=1 Tax=Nonomuraea rhizosphaerae TaxID=2665663 RepID=UPI001C5DF190|nr:hypothetical protein [Nonomuraea rhizosphaerae]
MVAGTRTFVELVPLIQAHSPVVRYYMNRVIPGQPIYVEASPWQVDVFVPPGLMPQEVADELAGHYTHAIRYIRLGGLDGPTRQAVQLPRHHYR